MPESVKPRALERALAVLGEQGVSERLNVPIERLHWWLHGSVPIPDRAFLAIVDLLLEHGLAELKQQISGSHDAPFKRD